MATFSNLGPFSYTAPMALWIIYFIVNGAMFLIYTISQIILVTNTLDDRWPLGDIAFGMLFFVSGLVIMHVFSVALCEEMKHYLDGLFFGSMCNLLAVMMVYKYWDSITKEDLEFSIDSKYQDWEIQAFLNGKQNEKVNHRAYDM
jgi:protein-S-isoprenylcysteine O-methyltransferase Ste14